MSTYFLSQHRCTATAQVSHMCQITEHNLERISFLIAFFYCDPGVSRHSQRYSIYQITFTFLLVILVAADKYSVVTCLPSQGRFSKCFAARFKLVHYSVFSIDRMTPCSHMRGQNNPGFQKILLQACFSQPRSQSKLLPTVVAWST